MWPFDRVLSAIFEPNEPEPTVGSWENEQELVEVGGVVIREYIVLVTLFLTLNVLAYSFITWIRTPEEKRLTRRIRSPSATLTPRGSYPDEISYTVSTVIATFSLAISAAAILLFPLSVLCHEVLFLWPHSSYLEWLNSNLVTLTWNWVYQLANLLMFLGVPFAYYFADADYSLLTRTKSRLMRFQIMTRAAVATLPLLFMLYLCLAVVYVSSLISGDEEPSLFGVLTVWRLIPHLQTFLLRLGEWLILLSAPWGFYKVQALVDLWHAAGVTHAQLVDRLEQLLVEETVLTRRYHIAPKMMSCDDELHNNGSNGIFIIQLLARFLLSKRKK